jgi:hypothetical protein
VGPALKHFRAFQIWVPQTSAFRISSTVWWFFQHQEPDLLELQDASISYPPTRDRPFPQPDGSDLLGRHFFEPELGVCCITRLGPVTQKRLSSRAQLNNRDTQDLPIALGAHFTLYYQCVSSREEHFSSVDEVDQWIKKGPILRPPVEQFRTRTNVSAHPHNRPQAQLAPIEEPSPRIPRNLAPLSAVPQPDLNCRPNVAQNIDQVDQTLRKMTPETTREAPLRMIQDRETLPPTPPANIQPTRQSTRKRAPRDILHPTHHGKVYQAGMEMRFPKKQRVPVTLEYEGKQRVTIPAHKETRRQFAFDTTVPFNTTANMENYKKLYEKFKICLHEKRNTRIGWSDIFGNLTPDDIQRLFIKFVKTQPKPCPLTAHGVFD